MEPFGLDLGMAHLNLMHIGPFLPYDPGIPPLLPQSMIPDQDLISFLQILGLGLFIILLFLSWLLCPSLGNL